VPAFARFAFGVPPVRRDPVDAIADARGRFDVHLRKLSARIKKTRQVDSTHWPPKPLSRVDAQDIILVVGNDE
jgi:hypothetical protein